MSNYLFDLQSLLESGGLVLWLIVLVSVIMWMLILERYLFVYVTHPKKVKALISLWRQREDKHSWYAQKIRQGMIAESTRLLNRHLITIKTLIVALPILGLLGTVDGMIHTFDVLAVFGTGNARGMAGGISIALITTMGGLLTALSGMYFSAELEQRVVRLVDNVADMMRRG